jgi:putative transposase
MAIPETFRRDVVAMARRREGPLRTIADDLAVSEDCPYRRIDRSTSKMTIERSLSVALRQLIRTAMRSDRGSQFHSKELERSKESWATESIRRVDVSVRRLATVATVDRVIGELANPRALEHRLPELRRLQRQRARRTCGSRQYARTAAKITRLHAEVAHVRQHTIHYVETATLAKTHGVIVVEGLDAASLLQQKGLPSAKSRRRGLSDAAMGEIRRQLRYKCPWYGSTLIKADRFYPSSKTCHDCGHVQAIGWLEHWTCDECCSSHQRDDNAAINLARWASLGSVGAPVKRGAEHQTESHSAAGDDTRKGSPASVGPNNSVRSAA